MRPGVSLKLVAACESFAAENPAADKGPLASVQPYVRSEKRRFPEGLLTSGDVADVFPLPHFPGPVARDKCAVLQFRDMHEQASACVTLTSCLRLYSWDTCTPYASSSPLAGWAAPA